MPINIIWSVDTGRTNSVIAVRSRPDTVRSRLDRAYCYCVRATHSPPSQMLRELPFGENILEVFRQNGESKFLLTSEWK